MSQEVFTLDTYLYMKVVLWDLMTILVVKYSFIYVLKEIF